MNDDQPNFNTNLGIEEDPDTIFTVTFWKRTADRAVKTFLQVLVVTLAGPALASSAGADLGGLLSIPWQGGVTAAVGATILSLASSLIGRKVGNNPADPAWVPTNLVVAKQRTQG